MAFDQNPAIAALFPAMGNPDGAGMRWTRPTAMNPDVAVAVPAVITVDPYPSLVRWTVMMLNDGWRWCNADDDLRHRNRRRETQSEQPCQKSFLHWNLYLRGLDLPESGSLFLAITAFSILLLTECRMSSGNFLKKLPPGTMRRELFLKEKCLILNLPIRLDSTQERAWES